MTSEEAEEEAILELKALIDNNPDCAPFTNIKWVCGCKRCNRYTRARDYGLYTEFWHKRHGWFTPDAILFCAAHWKFLKKMERLYGQYGKQRAIQLMVDFNKETIIPINK